MLENYTFYFETIHKLKNSKIKGFIESYIGTTNNLLKEFLEEYIALESKLEYIEANTLKGNRNCCQKCRDLQQDVDKKQEILQSTASKLSIINNTQNYKSIDEIIEFLNKETISQNVMEGVQNGTPKKGSTLMENDLNAELSMSEIEGTPTGCKSPILNYKKPIKRPKEYSQTDSEERGILKSSPKKKVVKLSQPSPSSGFKTKSKLKQLRLNISKPSKVNVVDLTCSPDMNVVFEKKIIKKESNENEDIIQPSPTSSVKQEFSALYKSFGDSKKSQSPNKFKKPPLKSKLTTIKSEDPKIFLETHTNDQENSFNLLQPFNTDIKTDKPARDISIDETICEDENILPTIKIENKENDKFGKNRSPSKSPLIENKNFNNTTVDFSTDSISLLPLNKEPYHQKTDKRTKPDNCEYLYKEPTVRKKAEKLALPGWSCEKCKNFYDVVYKDNPEILRKLMSECSRHRSRYNPARPPTPPGYWDPRWEVATDTETFNRQNNV